MEVLGCLLIGFALVYFFFDTLVYYVLKGIAALFGIKLPPRQPKRPKKKEEPRKPEAHQSSSRKIYRADEGEYVDFEEIK